MFEFEPEKQESCDVQYYIDNIAVDLAGREAEIIFTNSEKHLTSGAYQDSKSWCRVSKLAEVFFPSKTSVSF